MIVYLSYYAAVKFLW